MPGGAQGREITNEKNLHLGEQRLACARGAAEESAFRNFGAKGFEFVGIAKELDELDNLNLSKDFTTSARNSMHTI